LVTGGAGFIGSNVVDALLRQNHSVVVVDDESATSNTQFYRPKGNYYKVDICDYPAMDNIFKRHEPTCILHLAAKARIQPSIQNPEATINTNMMGTLNLLKLGHKYGANRLVLSSTSAVYGLKNVPPLKEDMPRQCLNPYSISKASAEDLCTFYYKVHGFKTIILRYFNVFGPRQPLKGDYAPVVGLFLRQREAGTPLTIVGDGSQTRDFTHVTDVVAANILASTTFANVFGSAVNIGSGESCSVLQLAKMLDCPYEFIPARPGEMQDTRADITKGRQLLEWSPTLDIEQYIHDNNI
jgi:UDP-glucose 4-epimerase